MASPPEPAGWIAGGAFVGGDRLCMATREARLHLWDLTASRRELGALGLDWADR
ncbi:MAG: hypothetical protein JNL39_10055 [Opitutaceae bacterium]|nr:hypothetical protein [Opitutaceae bacterium]